MYYNVKLKMKKKNYVNNKNAIESVTEFGVKRGEIFIHLVRPEFQ